MTFARCNCPGFCPEHPRSNFQYSSISDASKWIRLGSKYVREACIIIDGAIAHTQPNCVYGLEQLRSAAVAEWHWVDAICIDQNDLEEKGKQVAIMAEVYAKARHVCVSCGPGCETALTILESVLSKSFPRTEREGYEHCRACYARCCAPALLGASVGKSTILSRCLAWAYDR